LLDLCRNPGRPEQYGKKPFKHLGTNMTLEHDVARHYGDTALITRILAGLEAAGADLDNLELEDLAPVDEFHLGGRKTLLQSHLTTAHLATAPSTRAVFFLYNPQLPYYRGSNQAPSKLSARHALRVGLLFVSHTRCGQTGSPSESSGSRLRSPH